MGVTSIEWTATVNPDGTTTPGRTWSPIRARVRSDAGRIAKEKGYTSLVQIAEKMAGHVGPHCEMVSDGCSRCYSATNNHRCLPANGTGLPFDRRSRDLIEPILDEKILLQPLSWKKPCKVFVANQTDLFGEWVPYDMIDRIFEIMALTPHITYQLLTKRPKRALTWISESMINPRRPLHSDARFKTTGFRNIWMGVSVEDQGTADERITTLLKIPATIRFVSYEPALGPVNFETFIGPDYRDGTPNAVPALDLLICGGESGPGARPFNVHHAIDALNQCKQSGTSFFMKQLGAKPIFTSGFDYRLWPSDTKWAARGNGITELKLRDKKGGDIEEWDSRLRVREFPKVPA